VVGCTAALGLPASALAVGTMTGQVFYDPPVGANVPMPGVQVQLRTTANAPVGSPATTDANGNFSLTAFANGSFTYKVRLFPNPTVPFSPITPASGEYAAVVPSDGATTTGLNFSVRGSRVTGLVFQDRDGDGVKNGTDSNLGGATVSVAGPVSKSVTSAVDGTFTTGQPILPAGTYTVTAGKTDYNATTPAGIASPAIGGDAASQNLGLRFATGTVQGDVYAETNGAPGRQAGEPPIAGAAISVTGSYDSQPFTLDATSGSDGTFSLPVFVGTSRTVAAAQPSAYLDGAESTAAAGATTGPDQFTTVTVTEDTAIGRFQFGETGATITGLTFSDRDAEGQLDAGEPPTGNRALSVTATGFDQTVTSAADGTFSVSGLPGGVDVTLTPAVTSDAIAPVARILQPAVGGALANVFLGYRFGDIKGKVLNRQTGSPIAGVAVTLSGSADRTTTTAADGSFGFPELAPGTYSVRATPPAGFARASSVAGSAGGAADADGVSTIGVGLGQLGTGYELGLLPPATGDSSPTGIAARTVSIVARKRTNVRKARLALTCRLDQGEVRSCAFAIRTKRKGGRVLARGSATATGTSRSLKVTLKLSKLGKAKLGRTTKPLRAVARVSARDATGKTLKASKRVRLRRR
jgi:hypothetical protein